MRFIKMHGIGNDYVYVDLFREAVPEAAMPQLARDVSDRHFGVGSDGLIFIAPPTDAARGEAPVQMRMFNADGSESEMCGNGLRCVVKYAREAGLVGEDAFRVETGAGLLKVIAYQEGDHVARVRVDMGEPELCNEVIPTAGIPGERTVDHTLQVGDASVTGTAISIGNPHFVVELETDPREYPVTTVGPRLETHPYFPRFTNVEFVRVLDRRTIAQRTWERGAGETLACGTGACAVAVACALRDRTDRRVTVQLLGGNLDVEWDDASNHVFMTGPATEVFRGEWPTSW